MSVRTRETVLTPFMLSKHRWHIFCHNQECGRELMEGDAVVRAGSKSPKYYCSECFYPEPRACALDSIPEPVHIPKELPDLWIPEEYRTRYSRKHRYSWTLRRPDVKRLKLDSIYNHY